MAYITLFSAPKAFTDPHIATIQRNAIQSWLHLPEIEVLLVGSEPGLAETASELGVQILPNVHRNAQGTPLVSSIFDLAHAYSNSPIMVYVNADMLFSSDLVQAAQIVHAQCNQFLIVGQRWDLNITEPMVFSNGWETYLRHMIQVKGKLHPPQGSDYFIFPRNQFVEMPAFAIGRAGWDNWMIYYARQQDWPVIDATASIHAVHQNHDYSHLPGGQPHYNLEESQQNTALAGGLANMYNMLDTNRVLVEGKLQRPPLSLARATRWTELKLMPAENQRYGIRWWTVRRLRKLRRKLTHNTLEG